MLDFVNQRTVALLGHVGTGKSATGNNLFGRNELKLRKTTMTSSISNIAIGRCIRQVFYHELQLEIVDTPRLFQTRNVAETALKIIEAIDVKPNVLVLVLRSEHFTADDKYTAEMLYINLFATYSNAR
ncbi:hypothetical protein DPMN_145149 [Dreissena polymorpha]|uniref:AIG1-type G domain-containing protein n=1 Tax=Dreissena polymorpha TaxID=45954 RepID=A0A9D4IX79_DREPO|nr:hypothetical protein DPMN_145149 [Dreissena polymorpha]